MTDFEDEDIPDLEDEDHPFTDEDASEPPPPTPWRDFIAGGTDKAISARFVEEATQLLEKHDKVADTYACFGLLDESSGIGEWELSRMFAALRRRNPDRDTDVLLILQGPGGSIEHAYQISKLCQQFSPECFAVSVPRQAKSALTLLALGADAIHVGPLGHLGPIDPQLRGMPALAVKQALETIAVLCEEHPASTEVFASYLKMVLSVEQIGYSERVCESAIQYAERLLSNKESLPRPVAEIARSLVHSYKDHGFVIDLEEAQAILGEDLVQSETPEVEFAEDFYSLFRQVDFWLGSLQKKQLFLAGEIVEPPLILPRED